MRIKLVSAIRKRPIVGGVPSPKIGAGAAGDAGESLLTCFQPARALPPGSRRTQTHMSASAG